MNQDKIQISKSDVKDLLDLAKNAVWKMKHQVMSDSGHVENLTRGLTFENREEVKRLTLDAIETMTGVINHLAIELPPAEILIQRISLLLEE